MVVLAPRLRGQLAAPAPVARPDPGDGPGSLGHDPDYQRLLAALGFDPTAPDELIQRTGLAAAAVSSMLLVLELEGHVSSTPEADSHGSGEG